MSHNSEFTTSRKVVATSYHNLNKFLKNVPRLVAHLHCRIRTRTRTRIPNPMATLYYAELFTLVRIRTRIPVRRDSPIATVPILGTDLCPNKPVHTIFSCLCLHVLPFFIKSLSTKMARCRVLTRKARKQRIQRKRLRIFVLFTLWQMCQVERNIWVHPLNMERTAKGEFYTLYPDQQKYPDRFFENYRMSVQQFDYLLQLVILLIEGKYSNFRTPISPEQKLVLTLR